jgi:hypothetical protein
VKKVIQHANTMEKNPPRNREELFEDDIYIHNTTGDQDRKRRKTCVKTLVLSGNKNYENEPTACPQIG